MEATAPATLQHTMSSSRPQQRLRVSINVDSFLSVEKMPRWSDQGAPSGVPKGALLTLA